MSEDLPMTIRRLPKFANEAEEADWWYEHRNEVADDLIAASRAGTLGPGTRVRYQQRMAKIVAEEAAAKQELISSKS